MRKNKGFSLTYLLEMGNEITLLFRDEKSASEHIEKNKISKFTLISRYDKKSSGFSGNSLKSGISNFVSYRHTTRRGVGGC